MKFCIQKGHQGREALAVRLSAEKLGMECVYRDFPMEGEVPVGTVEFCEVAFGPHRIDFFPDFLKGRLFRDVVKSWGGYALSKPAFVKDASAWKSVWETGLHPAGMQLPRAEWWLSEPVRFVNEWRYYVADGYVITSGWYAGEDEDKPAPKLDIGWPKGFSGAVDFGELEDGFLALVEAHAPFACGWYGETHLDYAHWLKMAWKDHGWWALDSARHS